MDCPIAIVGISCRFAGCASPPALWNAIMARRSLLTLPGADAEIPIGQRNVFDRPYPTRLGQLGALYPCVSHGPPAQHLPRQITAAAPLRLPASMIVAAPPNAHSRAIQDTNR